MTPLSLLLPLLLMFVAPTLSQAAVNITWDWSTTAPDNFQLQRCEVAVGQAACLVTADLAGAVVAGNVVTYVDLSTVSGKNYCYTVQAIVAGVRSGSSNRLCMPDITTGLVAHYHMDEGSATAMADATANANHGTIGSGATWQAGKFGTGVSIGTSASGATVPASASLNNLPALTVSAWIYPRSYPGAYPALVDKNTPTSGSATGWLFYLIDPGGLGLYVAYNVDEGVYSQTGSNLVPLNQWSHVVATWTGSALATSQIFYLNSVLQASTLQVDAPGSRKDDSDKPLLMGNTPRSYNRGDLAFDEVRIYNRALTAVDVQKLYAYTPPAVVAPPTVFRLRKP